MHESGYELVIAIANGGYSDMVMEAASAAGAQGGTVLHTRATDADNANKFFGLAITEEREMILLVTSADKRAAIMQAIMEKAGAQSEAQSVVFSVKLGWFDLVGLTGRDFNTLSAFGQLLDMAKHLVLPIVTLVFISIGPWMRYVRTNMLEVLNADYIRTARAKGLREKVVVYSHAWRNALLPVITVLIGWFISIFSGSLIIEQMFALNGMGQLYYQGLMNNDFELALAIQMFYVLIALVGQLITDLSYGLVDPRVRVNK